MVRTWDTILMIAQEHPEISIHFSLAKTPLWPYCRRYLRLFCIRSFSFELCRAGDAPTFQWISIFIKRFGWKKLKFYSTGAAEKDIALCGAAAAGWVDANGVWELLSFIWSDFMFDDLSLRIKYSGQREIVMASYTQFSAWYYNIF